MLFTVAKYHHAFCKRIIPFSFRYGRRILSLISGAGMAVTMICLGIYLEVGDGSSDLSLLPLLLILIYIVSTEHILLGYYHNVLLYPNTTPEIHTLGKT
jgi:hypothetical protein